MELKLKKKPELRIDSAKITQRLKAELEAKKRAALQAQMKPAPIESFQPRFQMPNNPLQQALLQQRQQAQLIRARTIQFQTEQGLVEQMELTYKV